MPRVVAVFPEPTPYRTPLFDLLARELDLTVVYSARTVAGRTWAISVAHDTRFLRGVRVPGMRRLLRHDYPLTPGIVRLLEQLEPDVVVVSGWSTFAAQAAVVWCRLRNVPYIVLSESHDADPRPGWRRTIKRAIVPRIVGRAAALLAAGSLARRSLVAHGGDADAIWVFANTIDVAAFAMRTDALREHRDDVRGRLGLSEDDLVILSVARLAPEKGLDTLLRAAAGMSGPAAVLIAGDGPLRDELDRLARDLGVRLVLAGDRPWEHIAEMYAAADVFALLSRHEPWGVVVVEAAAAALPLVLSAHVGAAADLLDPPRNGALVPVNDVAASALALDSLAGADARDAAGRASRAIAEGWGYDASIEGFRAAIRHATAE